MSLKVGPTSTMRTITEILALNWLSSPALPIGAFAWSQGLESAITTGAVTNKQDLTEYLEVQLHYGLATFDLPLLKRLKAAAAQASKDATAQASKGQESELNPNQVPELNPTPAPELQASSARVLELDAWVKAGRGTRELLAEEEHLGRALMRLMRSTALCPDWAIPLDLGYVAAFAIAVRDLDQDAVLASFALAWLQNLVTVACKALPLGQTQGQQVLLALMPQLEGATHKAVTLRDDEIGTVLPGLMELSSRHERQYTRLFRS